MKFSTQTLYCAVLLTTTTTSCHGYMIQHQRNHPVPMTSRPAATTTSSITTMLMTSEAGPSDPSTFREAEVLGLRLMQEGNFEEALVGMFLRSCFCFCLFLFCFIHKTSPVRFVRLCTTRLRCFLRFPAVNDTDDLLCSSNDNLKSSHLSFQKTLTSMLLCLFSFLHLPFRPLLLLANSTAVSPK